jgi:hypothetical protein
MSSAFSLSDAAKGGFSLKKSRPYSFRKTSADILKTLQLHIFHDQLEPKVDVQLHLAMKQ